MMQEENDTPLTADDLELYTRSHIEAMAERIVTLEANQVVLHQKIADLNRDVFQLNKNVKATDARLIILEKLVGTLQQDIQPTEETQLPPLPNNGRHSRHRNDTPFMRVVTLDGVPVEIK